MIILISLVAFPLPLISNDKPGTPDWFKILYWTGFTYAIGKYIINDTILGHSDPLDEKKQDNSYLAIKYILPEADISEFDQLVTKEDKDSFINDYWENSFLDKEKSKLLQKEFEQRTKIADSLYQSAFCDGWKTDMGRIYILYGPPDDITRYPMMDVDDYEFWYYDKMRGTNKIPMNLQFINDDRILFLFTRTDGAGDYLQIFSTEPGEINHYLEIIKIN